MLVCHCLRVFERTVKECVREGARCADEVAERCGAGSRCGGCRPSVEDIIERETSSAELGPLVSIRSAA
jgi:bacterioferritin-associated ferredoxin